MKKRTLALIMASAMCASLFAGCGSSSSTTTSDAATSEAATSEAATTEAATTEASSESDVEPEYVVKLSHNGAAQGAQYEGQCYFKERLEELSGGRIRVDIYPGATLGEKAASMEGLQLGTIEMTEVSLIDMSGYNDKWEAFAMPYFFEDGDQACAVCRDETVNEILESNAEENGFIVLSYVSVGSRDIYSSKPINSVADMKGLKIRVMGSNSLVTAMEDLGASPLTMSWSDCYSAMQQGTIEAVENATEIIYSNGFTDLDGAYSFTSHFTIPDLILFSKAVYDTLPEDLQEAVIQAGLDTEDQWNNVIFKEANEEALKTMEENGVEILYPDLTEFQEIGAQTREKLAASFSEEEKELYDAIDACKDNYK